MTGKNPTLAELGIDLASLRKYELDLRSGKVKTDGTLADHAAAMEAIDKLGMIPGGWPPKPDESSDASFRAELAAELAVARATRAIEPATPILPPRTLASVGAEWIAERLQKNKPRTVYAKECHFDNFTTHLASLCNMDTFDAAELAAFKKRQQAQAKEAAEKAGKAFRSVPDRLLNGQFVATKTDMAEMGKSSVVGFKTALVGAKQNPKTVDNKLLTLSDFFEYAMGNGIYKSADGGNPVSGTYILTKKERTDKAEPYKPFTPDDIARMFEPTAYKAKMSAADLYWCPLIGLHSGMRISEAAGIYVDDVHKSSNGVDIIHVRKSKTSAGVRDVPIAKAMIDLGFLDFVAQQRAAGHERLFPDRVLVNDSFSKELGIAFREHLIAVGVRQRTDAKERKSFHSFRVNVVTQLTDNGASTIQGMRIVGHDTGASQGLATHAGYVRDLPSLKRLVDGLVWPISLAGLQLP